MTGGENWEVHWKGESNFEAVMELVEVLGCLPSALLFFKCIVRKTGHVKKWGVGWGVVSLPPERVIIDRTT